MHVRLLRISVARNLGKSHHSVLLVPIAKNTTNISQIYHKYTTKVLQNVILYHKNVILYYKNVILYHKKE